MRIASSIRTKVLLLSFLTIGPVIALLGYYSWDQLQQSRRIEADHLVHVAKLVASKYEQINEGARQLLITLSISPQINSSQCKQYLSDLLKQYRRYANIGVTDNQGNVICSAVELNEPVNLADRYFFQKTFTSKDFTVGEYVISRVTGKPSLNFGYPLPDGRGVVYSSLNLSWLGEIIADLKLDPNVVAKIFDRNGTVLARYPDSERWTGVHSVDTTSLEQLISSEITEINTGVDGVERLYAYQRIGLTAEGPFIAVGIPEATIFKHSQADFIKNLGLSAAVALSSLTVGWKIGSSLISKTIDDIKKVDDLKRDFVSLVTHQIRTPLTAIKWFTQILYSGSPGKLSRPQKKLLQDTSESVTRMTGLVSILLTIAKLESGKIPLNPQPASLKKMIEDVHGQIQQVYRNKKVKFIFTIGTNVPPSISLDTQLILQVLTNLLSNAYKYSYPGEQVKVSLTKSQNEIKVEVHNRGIGIKKEDYDKLWSKFARGSNAHLKDTEGAGLGLYLCKLIIGAHNGKIWFTDSPKKGTSFLFTIPIKVS